MSEPFIIKAVIDLDDIGTEAMITALWDRGRCPRSNELDRAGDYFRRGDVAEALIWLERALPDTFAGLATAVVPARLTRSPS